MDGNQFTYNKPLNLARVAPLLEILKRKLKAVKYEVFPGIVSLQAASHHAVVYNSSWLDCVFVSGEPSYISIPVVVDANTLYTVLLTFEKEKAFSGKDRELVDAFQSTLSAVSRCITPSTEAVDAFVSTGTLLASLLLAVQPPLQLVNEASARLLALHIHRDRDNRDRDMRMDAARELEYRVRRLGAVCRRGVLGCGEVPTLSSSSSRSLASVTTCPYCCSQSDAEGSTRRYGSSDSNLGDSHDPMYTMGDIGLILGDYRSIAGEARVGYLGCSHCDRLAKKRSYLPSTASRDASRPSLGRETEQKASSCSRWVWRRLSCLGCFWPAAS
eukprot:gene30208-36494_t